MLDVPEGYDWKIWRLICSDTISVGLKELENEWTLADVENAHLALDIIEDARILSRPETRKK